MSLQVRIFNASATSYRVFPLARVAGIPSARVTSNMGYADAEIVLLGSQNDSALQDWTERRRVEFWFDGQLGYRGYVERIQPLQTEPRQVHVTLYGRYYRLGKINLQKRYSYAALSATLIITGREIADIYGDLISRYVLPLQSNLESEALFTGYQITALDAFNVQLASVTENLISYTAQNIVIGSDVNQATGNDRIYLRPNNPLIVTTVTVPSGATGARESDDDNTELVNTVTILGGKSQFGNLLADAVEGNASFEYVVSSGVGAGNLVKNPSFEDGTRSSSSEWKMTGAFTVPFFSQTGSDSSASLSGFARTGSWFVLAYNLVGFPDVYQQSWDIGVTATPGFSYQFSLWAKNQYKDQSGTARMSLQWYASDHVTTIGAAVTLDIAPTTQNWYVQYGFTSVAPVGGVHYKIRLQSLNGLAVASDDWAFFSTAQTLQQGWQLYTDGGSGATYSGSNMAVEDAYHGGYSVLINATANDAIGQDVLLRPYNKARFAVNPLSSLHFGFYGKLAPGQTTHPKMQLTADYYDSGGNLLTSSTQTNVVAANSFTSTWSYKDFVQTVPTTAVSCLVYLAVRGNGQILVDAFYVRDSTVAAGSFIEGSQYQRTYDVLTAGFASTTDVYQQNVVNGVLREVLSTSVSVPNVATDTDALNYAVAYLSRYGVTQTRNSVVSYKFLPVWVGQYIRAVGSSSTEWPRPTNTPIQPITEILMEWDGKLKQTLFLTTERLTQARVIKRLISAGGAAIVSGGNANTGSVSGIGGGISGFSGLAPLSPDPSGLYDGAHHSFTVNSVGQVTGVGSGTPTAGTTGLMYIGKLTPGGNNGTAQLLAGQVTIVSQAT